MLRALTQEREPRRERTWRIGLFLFALSLATVRTWAVRYNSNPDAVSYSDLAGALLRGEWMKGISSYWSPGYPALIALALKIFPASGPRLLVLIHSFNLIGFGLALLAFDWFWRRV